MIRLDDNFEFNGYKVSSLLVCCLVGGLNRESLVIDNKNTGLTLGSIIY